MKGKDMTVTEALKRGFKNTWQIIRNGWDIAKTGKGASEVFGEQAFLQLKENGLLPVVKGKVANKRQKIEIESTLIWAYRIASDDTLHSVPYTVDNLEPVVLKEAKKKLKELLG